MRFAPKRFNIKSKRYRWALSYLSPDILICTLTIPYLRTRRNGMLRWFHRGKEGQGAQSGFSQAHSPSRIAHRAQRNAFVELTQPERAGATGGLFTSSLTPLFSKQAVLGSLPHSELFRFPQQSMVHHHITRTRVAQSLIAYCNIQFQRDT